mgnify:CR=1 FL=1
MRNSYHFLVSIKMNYLIYKMNLKEIFYDLSVIDRLKFNDSNNW